MSATLLELALRYATLDEWHIFPLHPRGKKPLTDHGFLEATTDVDQIRRWWTDNPAANIGIALGASGLAVIDIDGPLTPESFDVLAALELPRTRIVTTGREDGGEHQYYYLPSGVEIGTRDLAERLELRSSGAYVVAPGSIHQTGRVYTADTADIVALDAAAVRRLQTSARPRSAPAVAGAITAGQRNKTLTSLAGTMRRRGFSEGGIVAALLAENETACKPPLPGREVATIARSVAGYQPDDTASPGPKTYRVVTLEQFVGVAEDGADAIVGEPGAILIPEDALVMVYGDGGAGKTTLTVDLGCHLAAGDPWLGIPIRRATRVLIVENEGPRPLFRDKLRRKFEAWSGSALGDRVSVLEEPWASLRFDDADDAEALARIIGENEIDVVIIGPVTAAGMEAAGTIQDVRAFEKLVKHVGTLAGRLVTVILIHHENRAGTVSGAWEGVVDTMLHVHGQGHGKTRVFVQKARWSPVHHATTMQLTWADGAGFTLEDKPEMDEDTIAESILRYAAEHPGAVWGKFAADAIKGTARENGKRVRDRLLASGQIVNRGKDEHGAEALLNHVVEAKPARLYLPEDPDIQHLCRGSGTVPAQPVPAGTPGGELSLCRVPRSIEAHGVGTAAGIPDLEDAS